MDELGNEFPKGEATLHRALRRVGVRPETIDSRLRYNGVSRSLEVRSTALDYKRVVQLPPEDLRDDTAWRELCESIAEELARLDRGAGAAPQR